MISFYTQDTPFVYKGKRFTSAWLKKVAENEGCRIGDISIVFCSDPYILNINKKYLKHDYYTDIITFDYCEEEVLNGDVFISVDTVKANAQEYGTLFHVELSRVIVHGILHLIGYDDHTDADIAEMRMKEDEYLELLETMK